MVNLTILFKQIKIQVKNWYDDWLCKSYSKVLVNMHTYNEDIIIIVKLWF